MHVFVFGVYRSPAQFVHQALTLAHPFDSARALPDPLVRRFWAVARLEAAVGVGGRAEGVDLLQARLTPLP